MTNPNEIFFHKIESKNEKILELFEKGVNRDIYCLIICINGKIKIQLDGKTYELSDGDVCIYSPERDIRLLNLSQNFTCVLVGGSNNIIQNSLHSIFSAERKLYMRSNPTFHLEKEQRQKLFNIINAGFEIISENVEEQHKNATNSVYHEKTLRALLDSVCFYVLDLYSRSRALDNSKEISMSTHSAILQKFLISLYYNYIKERSVEFYANQQRLSKRYFSTTIRTESGKTPKQWIEEIVIEEIKHYLSNDSMTIKEIAYHFNFPSQSFFGKYFKQAVGVSPKEYRDREMGK